MPSKKIEFTEPLVTPKQVDKILGMSIHQVHRLATPRVALSARAMRYRRADVDAFGQAQSTVPADSAGATTVASKGGDMGHGVPRTTLLYNDLRRGVTTGVTSYLLVDRY